jgi:hypothetical protein
MQWDWRVDENCAKVKPVDADRLPLLPTKTFGEVDAEQARLQPDRHGVEAWRQVVRAGTAPRRAPVFIESTTVPAELASHLGRYLGQTDNRYPDRYLLRLREPLLLGEGTVVLASATSPAVLRDSCVEFLAHNACPTGMTRNEDGQFRVAVPVTRHITAPCLLLKRPWSHNYGHWLVDQAMALSWLARVGALHGQELVVSQVPSHWLHQAMRDTIAAILPGAVVHEHPHNETWSFRTLDYITPLHVPPLGKLPQAMDCLRRDVLALCAPPPLQAPRLHIVRQGGVRQLANEADLIALSSRYDFTPVQPEHYSLAEQATLFDAAEAVLGVKGAAMSNIVFANSRCRVILVSPGTFIDPFFWDIASQKDMAYSEVFGQSLSTQDKIDRFLIDVDALEAALLATLSAPNWPTMSVF